MTHRLDVAAGLCQRFGAHLIGLYARPQFDPPFLFDGGFLTGRYATAFAESVTTDLAAAHEAFAKAAGEHGKPASKRPSTDIRPRSAAPVRKLDACRGPVGPA